MSSNVYKFFVLMLSFAGLLALAACGNPCRTLATQVCKCKATEGLQQACVTALTDADESGPSAEQQETCSELLDTTCSGEDLCERLAQGDLAACGVSHAE